MMLWFILGTSLMGLSGLFIYLYYLKKGQFDDSEDVKYQMFREEK